MPCPPRPPLPPHHEHSGSSSCPSSATGVFQSPLPLHPPAPPPAAAPSLTARSPPRPVRGEQHANGCTQSRLISQPGSSGHALQNGAVWPQHPCPHPSVQLSAGQDGSIQAPPPPAPAPAPPCPGQRWRGPHPPPADPCRAAASAPHPQPPAAATRLPRSAAEEEAGVRCGVLGGGGGVQ
jgi:hypothetical protein